MEYRVNWRTGDRISAIGLGTSYIAESDEKTAIEALIYAYEHGINYADLATAGAKATVWMRIATGKRIRRMVCCSFCWI